MYPYIHTKWGEISTFTVLTAIGVMAMIGLLHVALKGPNRSNEEAFIYPRLVLTGLVGFVFAAAFDLLVKYIEYGVLKIYGITFYGGLIGAVLGLYLFLRLGEGRTQYSIAEWFEMITAPFIAFHFFGRLGCFFSGCCYGQVSDSVFALAFPDNARMGIFHFGLKCYPTQLFEALSLIVIFAVVKLVRHKFQTYLVCYALARFNLEFLRGDDRGAWLGKLSPSQVVSVVIVCGFIAWKLMNTLRLRTRKKQH